MNSHSFPPIWAFVAALLALGAVLTTDTAAARGVLSAAATAPPRQEPWNPKVGTIGGRPMVIGHRGASGYAPAAHTVESYKLAIAQGADCVECDIVATKDLQLVCNHDAWLSDTTDAEAKYPDRKRTYYLPEAGGNVTGVFAIDLTLAEVRALRVRQAEPQFWFRDRGLESSGALLVATFDDYIDAITSPANARVVCAIPEVKHATFHNRNAALRARNTTIDALVAAALRRRGYDLSAPLNSAAWLRRPLYIQSFEQTNLRAFWAKQTSVPTVQLVDDVPAADTGATPEYLTSDKGIKEIAAYATVYAPWKGLIVVTDGAAITRVNAAPIKTARALGMTYCVWTLRDEPRYLKPAAYKGNIFNEFALFFNVLQANSGFSDHPDVLAAYMKAGLYLRKGLTVANFAVFGAPGSSDWATAPRCDSVQPAALGEPGPGKYGMSEGMRCAYQHAVLPEGAPAPKPKAAAAAKAGTVTERG